MEGVILTMQKEELEEIVSRAVVLALSKKEEEKQEQADSEIMKTEDLCEYLKIKPSAVYQLTTYKKIPYIKKGKRVFFKKSEIDEWLRNGRQAVVFHGNDEKRLTGIKRLVK